MSGERRGAIVVFGIVSGFAVAGATMIGAIWLIAGPCGGDGGYPYSARDSTAGRACQTIDDAGLLVPVLPLLVTILVLGLAVCLARWSIAWLALAAGLAISLVPGFVLESLDPSCSHEDQKAFDAWARSGGRGTMPADCEQY